jgi:hypothetical protein
MTHGTLRHEPRQGSPSATALESSARVESFIERTGDLFSALRNASDLSPRNRELHTQLASYIKLVSYPWSDAQLAQIFHTDTGVTKKRTEINKGFAAVERATKLYWAPRLEQTDFTNFTLLGRNYDRQVLNELAALPIRQKPMKDKHQYMFYGSGALPIDAIQMCLKTGRRGTCVDADPEVVDAARKFLARTGYDKLLRYHLVEHSQSGYAYEDHTLLFLNNSEVDNFDAISNHSTVRWAEDAVIRSAVGANSLLYKAFSPTLANDLNIITKQTASSTPDTMQTSYFTTVIMSPESVAKPGIGAGSEGLPRALRDLQSGMLKPENQYLLIHSMPS